MPCHDFQRPPRTDKEARERAEFSARQDRELAELRSI